MQLGQSSSPGEKQSQEREALQAIFAEDFQCSVLDPSRFKISLRAQGSERERVMPMSVVLSFVFPPNYPLEPVLVAPEQCLGFAQSEESALTARLNNLAASPELEGQLAVFALAQEAQDWMSKCLETRSNNAGTNGNIGSNNGSNNNRPLSGPASEADKELQKKIADDLNRKKQLLLKTPESDWMHHVSSPQPSADSAGDDFEEDEDDEQNKDSLEDDGDDPGALNTNTTTSSSDRHAIVSSGSASSHSYPRLPKTVQQQPALRVSAPSLMSSNSAASTASAAAIMSSPPPPKSLRWKLGQLLSEGAGVRFFQAMNLETGSTMVIRQISFDPPLLRARADAVEKTVRYIQRLASPHLVPCRGFEWLPPAGSFSVLALFLPDLRGGSLDSLVKSFGPIPELSILRKYAGQMSQALQFLHERGVLHNNVSTASVFLDHRGNLKLADYGEDDKV